MLVDPTKGSEARAQAAVELSELGNARAVDSLISRLRSPAIGAAAAVALGKIGDIELLDLSPRS